VCEPELEDLYFSTSSLYRCAFCETLQLQVTVALLIIVSVNFGTKSVEIVSTKLSPFFAKCCERYDIIPPNLIIFFMLSLPVLLTGLTDC